MNTSTVKSLFFAFFTLSPFFVMDGFSIIYTTCGENLDGTVFCVELQNLDRLPKLQAGTTCEISSEVDLTFSDDYSNMNACRTEGVFLRNWRATDACGDTIYCTQRINVQFNTILECINPSSTLSCIDELTPETGKGLLFLTQSCLSSSAFTYTPTDDLSNLSELGEGFVIRTWELSHPCGYTRTCLQRINIQNNADPTVPCEPDDLEYECNGLRNNEAAATIWEEANKKKLKLCSADNCSDVTVTSDFDFGNLSDACGFTGTMTVVYTITDIQGNSTTKTATFTIIDTTAPSGNFGPTNSVISCSDVPSVKGFLIAQDAIHINELTNFSTENCGNLVVTSDFNASIIDENCQSQPETSVTYTLADECGNFETFVWNYTIINRAISDALCEDIEMTAINNELIINDLFAPNSIVKVFDANWQLIFDCSENCPQIITIPDLNTDEIYHTDIQLYDANWQFICEDKQDIRVAGIRPPCNVSICNRDVTFRTQEELDAFCGCEVIRGDLYIGAARDFFRDIPESNINSLASFRGLRRVEGSIIIVKTQLTDLKGLEELSDVPALIISENGQLKSLDGLRKVTKVNRTLSISKNPQLNTLAGLANLSAVEGQLNITENLRLKDLSALSNLKAAVSISISKNASLERLNGLENIDSLKNTNDNSGSLSISKNPLLKDIEALATLQFVERSLYISENPLLENCCPIAHLIDEDTTNGIVIDNISVFQNGLGFCGNKAEVIESCQVSTPCDTTICQGDVILQTQAEVDAFCGCTVIEGSLVIGSTTSDIDNLGSLQGLKVIKQGLVITQTSDLQSLKPLAELREIGGNFIFGANQSVMDFDGLQALTEVGGQLYIENNGLTSLVGLQQLTSIGEAFEIVNNYNLTELTNFDNLTYLTELLIGNNDKLQSLEGLNSLSVIENTLIIAQNEVLSDCCQILHLIDGNLEEGVVKRGIQIDNNPAFCSSIGEVIITCRTPPATCENIQINTQNNQIIIEGLTAPNEIVKVFDNNFNILYQCNGDCEETQIAGVLPTGDYTIDFQLYDENWGLICTEQRAIKLEENSPCNEAISCNSTISTFVNIPQLPTFDCGSQTLEYCLAIPLDNIANYEISVNGIPYNGSINICQYSASYAYTYFTLPVKDRDTEYRLNNWTINNQSYSTDFKNIQQLADSMNVWDTEGVWTLNEELIIIEGGNTTTNYGALDIIHLPSNAIATLQLNNNNGAEGISITIPFQANEITVLNKVANCMEIMNVKANCITCGDAIPMIDESINFQERKLYGGGCQDNYTLMRTWTENNNCEAIKLVEFINITDEIAPVLGNIPADITLECDDIPEISEAITVTDNCDREVAVTYNEERIDGNCTSNYQLIRTWTATDDCGNTASAQQVLVFGDFTAPILTNLPPDLTFNANDGFDTTFPIPVDNCDADPILTLEDVVNATETEIVRTFIATDNCGNTSTAQQIITIIRDEMDACADILITTDNEAINFTNIDAPNSIVKVYDDNYQIIFDCTATCENELVVPVVGIGIYHTDVQFYDENWQFICKDRQDIEIIDNGEPCDTSICQGDVFLRTQAEVDAFCGCAVIEGDLIIGESGNVDSLAGITSLSTLANLTTVNGSINIINSTIAEVTALNNLVEVGQTLAFADNPNLNNLNGLENLRSIGLQLVTSSNSNLIDMNALSGLKKIGGGLIVSNTPIDNLSFLNNLENNTLSHLEITACNNLTNLNGLEGISSLTETIGTSVVIAGNENLVDLGGIRNIRTVGGGFVLASNPILNDCCVITHLVDLEEDNGTVGGTITIRDNGSFCNSVADILQNCQNQSFDCNKVTIAIHQQDLTVANLVAPIQIVKVFDYNYATVYECFAECEETIKLTDLAAGRYHININFYNENWEPICERIETVEVAGIAEDRNTYLLPADFSLYPNPAESETFIDLSKLKGEQVQLALFNQFGQEIKQKIIEKVTTQKEKIDLSTLQNGVYILQIKAGGKRPIAKKLMVTRLY